MPPSSKGAVRRTRPVGTGPRAVLARARTYASRVDLTSVRTLAIVGAVVGELFGATAGLGQLIYNAGHTFDVNGVFAGMFVLAVLALIAEGLISALENRLIKWRPSRVSGEIPI